MPRTRSANLRERRPLPTTDTEAWLAAKTGSEVTRIFGRHRVDLVHQLAVRQHAIMG